MINYFTQVHVNDSFDRTVLLSMFFQWMQTSKNRMEHLDYHNESSFELIEGRKCLKIEDFKEFHLLGIQFTTSANYKYAQFVVELMYNYCDQTLGLSFYKELNEDSRYIEALSLPNIFVNLLKSEYISHDHHLKIDDQPVFCTWKQYQQLRRSSQLPLVVLSKKDKCIVNPFQLAQRMLGLAHVVCVFSSQSAEMKLVFKDGREVMIEKDASARMMKKCFDAALNESLEEKSQHYSFDELIKSRLLQTMKGSDEMNQYVFETVEVMKQEVDEIRQLHQMSYDQLNQLKQQKDELIRMYNSLDKDSILTCSENSAEKKEFLMRLIHQKLRNLKNNVIYRRRDVLMSIIKENEV